MIKNDIDILSEYYQYELSYLRTAGRDFAARFPKIARRLDLSHNESSDPHVERMIESFAFLTGKLQKQIDDQFPEIASVMLEALYEPLILTIPSCVMVNFDVDQARAAKAAGFKVPKNTSLQVISHSGETCSFRIAHDLALWPAEIRSAAVIQRESLPGYYARSTYYLKIEINYTPNAQQLPEKLRFYIRANALLRSKIFSAIFSTEESVLYQKDKHFEFVSAISPVGLGDDESLLPYPPTVHKGFRFLQEYFSFPDKFYGFDVKLPKNKDIAGDNFLYIPMSYDISMPVTPDNFSLSSVPAINIFSKITEPLHLDHRQVEYCLVPDYRRYSSHEIYRIEKMVAADPKDNSEIYIPEFFSCNHYSTNELGIFWKSRKKSTYMKDALGEDTYVSFIDTNFNPQNPADKIFYAYTLCTNRFTAEQIPVHGVLQMELSAPVKKIYCLDRPTIQKPSIKSGEVLWKLISALSLNSISFDKNGVNKIREVLEVFADASRSVLAGEIDSIVSMDSSIVTKRIDNQTWRGFVQGSEIEITFDDTISNLGIPLSLVLAKFLSSYTSINTFTEVSVKNTSRNGVLKKWGTQFGIKSYL
ncbi:MAG: type VI secretion system baseplate subunit TssF [Holosporaceae bacterium]|jgi:type VI secretion system protein ImpG|nr:type VI secretion system baseplate subunit TssF [Holosporaceae bacterium]